MKIYPLSMFLLLLILITGCSSATMNDANKRTANLIVALETSEGLIKIELFKDKAPISVENFLSYVNSEYYDGLIFHRVIKGFMIQGGGFDKGMNQKETKASIKNEANNSMKNLRGTIAMARTMVVDSATSQFFINVADNSLLDYRDNSAQGFGYAVFGKVVEGMDVVDAIESVNTGAVGAYQDVPIAPVIIKKAYVVK